MFTVKLWSFTKKVESTAQPTGTATEYSCNILTPADVTAPIVQIDASTDLTGYNYARIDAFHRYYWIDEIVFNEGMWELTLKCDVLATYKTQIGAESLYVLRSASAFDGRIIDNYYPTISPIDDQYVHTYEYQPLSTVPGYIVPTPGADPVYEGFEGGFIVLSIAGTGVAGSTTLIEFPVADFKRLMIALYRDIDGYTLGDVVAKVVQKFGGNPQQLINSALWIPFPITDGTYGGAVIGAWHAQDYNEYAQLVDIQGLYLNNPVEGLPPFEYTIYKHPQAATRGVYLNLAPFASYELFVPGAGSFFIDPELLVNNNKITVERALDGITGQMRTSVYGSDWEFPLADVVSQVGIPLFLHGSNNLSNISGSISTGISKIGAGFAAGGLAGGIIGGVSAGIGTLSAMFSGSPTSTGMSGGGAEILGHPGWLKTIFKPVTPEDNSHNGRPLMQVRTISTLSGYIQVQKGDVPIPGTQMEAEEIRAFLEGGFFYE